MIHQLTIQDQKISFFLDGPQYLSMLGDLEMFLDNYLLTGMKGDLYFGYSCLKLEKSNEQYFLKEFHENINEWSSNISRAIGYWHRQKSFASRWNCDFFPVRYNQLIACSKGVFDTNMDLELYRGDAIKNMTGWIFTTELYSGNIQDLEYHHVSHVIDSNPDFLDLLGIGPGGYIILSENRLKCEVGYTELL